MDYYGPSLLQDTLPGMFLSLSMVWDGPLLLTMDASFIQENLKLGVAPSDYTWNEERAQDTLDKIIEFLNDYPQVRVQTGHEM